MSVSSYNNPYTYIRSSYPEKIYTELDSILAPPTSTRIILKNESTLDGFNSLLKFIAATGVLDFLFAKVFSDTSSACHFHINEIDQFKLKAKIVKTLKKCKNWIDCHIESIDGIKVIPPHLFKKIMKWTIYLDNTPLKVKLELYNYFPHKTTADILQKSLIEDLYSIEDVSFLVSEKLDSLSNEYAKIVKDNIKINGYLKKFHAYFFNTINALRNASEFSILNEKLHEKLIDKISKWIMEVDVIDLNFILFFKKFYRLFSNFSFKRDFIVIPPPSKHDYFWDISTKIHPSEKKNSFYILINRSTKDGFYLNPLKLSDNGSIMIPIQNESHEYFVKNAIVYIGDDIISFNLFIESTLDENGSEKFILHRDDEMSIILKTHFVELAASAVLMQLSLKKLV